MAELEQGTEVTVLYSLSPYYYVEFIDPSTGREDKGYIDNRFLR